MTKLIASVFLVILLVPHEEAQAKLVDNSQTAELVIAEPGTSRMVIIVAADAGPWEKRAAVDLAKYIGLMTGANLPIVNWASYQRPGILIGKAAIMADPQTRSALQRVAKNDPVVQADAISVRRQGNRVYIAGSNDESHYFATRGCCSNGVADGICRPNSARSFRDASGFQSRSLTTYMRHHSKSVAIRSHGTETQRDRMNSNAAISCPVQHFLSGTHWTVTRMILSRRKYTL
jgi:hypothetical protein